MYRRSRGYYRYQRERAIEKKARILSSILGPNEPILWTHGCLGRLSKGKIHCSCPICRAKSYDHLSFTDEKKMLRFNSKWQEIRI